jgi:hypothetical protein
VPEQLVLEDVDETEAGDVRSGRFRLIYGALGNWMPPVRFGGRHCTIAVSQPLSENTSICHFRALVRHGDKQSRRTHIY